MRNRDARQAVVDIARQLHARGLGSGTAGNVSQRYGDGFLITPSALAYEEMVPEDVVQVKLDGRLRRGQRRPSSEWRFHRDIYWGRRDVNAVVHVHSDYATALACARRSIPAFHYMVALAGGDSIPCTGYAAFGTQALSDLAVTALRERDACLLANHGMISVGDSLAASLDLAVQVETLARQYCLTLRAAGPVLLSREEMDEVLARFADYAQPSRRATQ